MLVPEADGIPVPLTKALLFVDSETVSTVFFHNFEDTAPDIGTIRDAIGEHELAGIDRSHVVVVTDKGLDNISVPVCLRATDPDTEPEASEEFGDFDETDDKTLDSDGIDL